MDKCGNCNELIMKRIMGQHICSSIIKPCEIECNMNHAIDNKIIDYIKYNRCTKIIYLLKINNKLYCATVMHAFGAVDILYIVNNMKTIVFQDIPLNKNDIFTNLFSPDLDMSSDSPENDIFLCKINKNIDNVLTYDKNIHIKPNDIVHILSFVDKKLHCCKVRHVYNFGAVLDVKTLTNFNNWSGSPCLIYINNWYIIGHVSAGGEYIENRMPNFLTIFLYSSIIESLE